VGDDPWGEDLHRAMSRFPILWLFQRAMEFEQAYHAVPETPPFSWPRYFLLCHSMELALKAYLTLHGKTKSDLNPIRHHLDKLLEDAERYGLKVEPEELSPIFGDGLKDQAAAVWD
jgi:hypothetical protein